jgi:type I site-specific restriction-modification system R (restriction) subunit
MLAFEQMRGNTTDEPARRTYSVVAVIFFSEKEVARFPTREQAEWRARELNEWAERNPRGYLQYYVRPSKGTRNDG